MLVGLLAALSALIGLLLLTLGLIGVLSVATPNMQGFNAGQSVAISDGGMSVYSRSDTRSGTVCTAEGSDGPAVFERPVQEYAVDVTGSEFYEIARSPDDLASGTYAMTCAGTSEALYAGPWAPDTTTSGLMGPAGLVSGVLLLALAVALLILAVVLRARRKPAAASGYADDRGGHPGGQPGWQGSGAYSSPYATASQPAPAYGAPRGQEHAPDPQSHPYGAPPPPPSGTDGRYGAQRAHDGDESSTEQEPVESSDGSGPETADPHTGSDTGRDQDDDDWRTAPPR